LTLQFFDDEELAMIIEDTVTAPMPQRYLITARYANLVGTGQIVPSTDVDGAATLDKLLLQFNLGSPEVSAWMCFRPL